MRLLVFLTIFIILLCITAYAETHISPGEVSGLWEVTGSPYYIDGNINIPTDSTLVIEPGCSLVFTGFFKFEVDSNAFLYTDGVENDSIFFTASDTILTDSSGGWNGLNFNKSNDDSRVQCCCFEYANIFCIKVLA